MVMQANTRNYMLGKEAQVKHFLPIQGMGFWDFFHTLDKNCLKQKPLLKSVLFCGPNVKSLRFSSIILISNNTKCSVTKQQAQMDYE